MEQSYATGTSIGKFAGSKSAIQGKLVKLPADYDPEADEQVKFYPYHIMRTGQAAANDKEKFLKHMEGLTAPIFHQIMWPTTREEIPSDRRCLSYGMLTKFTEGFRKLCKNLPTTAPSQEEIVGRFVTTFLGFWE